MVMLKIDGAHGEGGGQIIRTSIAIASLKDTPIKIHNIRANRPRPGLSAQHEVAIKAAADICEGELKGANRGSETITFIPGDIRGGKYSFDIGTAGSITLMLQALIPIALYADGPVDLRIRGGTDVKWSPPYDYYENVFIRCLKKMGVHIRTRLLKKGHYPKGGGEVRVKIKPSTPMDYQVSDLSEKCDIYGKAFITDLDEDIARRMKKAALKVLLEHNVSIDIETHTSSSPGTGMTLWTEGERILGCGVLGEKGIPAEILGKKCAETLLEDIKGGYHLDPWCADQLIPYLCIANSGGELRVRKVTGHLSTNVWVVNRFGYELDLKEDKDTYYIVYQ